MIFGSVKRLSANLEVASVRTGADDGPAGNLETLILGPKSTSHQFRCSRPLSSCGLGACSLADQRRIGWRQQSHRGCRLSSRNDIRNLISEASTEFPFDLERQRSKRIV